MNDQQNQTEAACGGSDLTAELATTQTAKQRFDELFGELEESPLERLRFFCSLALNSQDWLDIEPFFDDVETMINGG